MAGSPDWKVYNADGEYRAATKGIEEAACLVSFLGKGATIRWGHSPKWVMWKEGFETQSAADSYDRTVEVVTRRLLDMQNKAYLKAYHAPVAETNKEGLTFAEWKVAADCWRKVPLSDDVARESWTAGIDPTEFALR